MTQAKILDKNIPQTVKWQLASGHLKNNKKRQMKKRLVIITTLLLCLQLSFAQKRTRADRFFEKGDYLNAAELYEAELATKLSKKALENISISYYNTFEYKQASRYLKLLVNGRFPEEDKTYDNQYNFKLYQVLSALGDYEASLDYFKRFKENYSASLDKRKAIETIEEFKLKSPDYNIKSTQYNSESSDFGAVKFNDSVYYTSDRLNKQVLYKTYKWTHRPFLDIYSVSVDDNLIPLSEPKALSKTVNTKLHEGNFCFSKDGNTMYVSKSSLSNGKKTFDDNSNNNIHLYKSIKTNNTWSKLEKLPFNTVGVSYQHPALSPDGKKLYFSSNREGGHGEYDIYYVTVNADGSYGEPINLGPTINTRHREHFPFISEEGHLFFSSNGHLGLGMLDVFASERVKNKFTKPVNLGVPVNSRYDDFNLNYFNKTDGFFASNRKNKNDDIYSFKQIGEIFIREYINIFEVRDIDTKVFIPNSSVILTTKKGEMKYNNKLGETSSFTANLLPGSYVLKGDNEAYKPGVINVQAIEKQDKTHVLYLKKIPPPPPPPPVDPLDAIAEKKGIDKDMRKKDPERFKLLTDTDGPPVVEKNGKLYFQLEPIYFDFNMWNIRDDSKIILDELIKKLNRFPKVELKISSHTDGRGSERYNQVLSERRAESTRNYIAIEGYINAKRLQFEGFGEKQHIIPCPMNNCSEEEHQLNRRSEFEILKYD